MGFTRPFASYLGALLCSASLSFAPAALATPEQDLFKAIADANLAGVQKAHQLKADLNAVDEYKISVMQRAIEAGNPAIVKWLLDHGARVPTDAEAQMMMHSSLFVGHQLALIQMLMAKGLKAPTPDDGADYLIYALEAGRLDALEHYLRLGFNPNLLMINTGEEFAEAKYGTGAIDRPMLHHAIDAGNIKALQILLRYKADPNLPSADGSTALMYAIQAKQTAIATQLLSLRPKVGQQNKIGNTALHLALETDQTSLVSSLLALGASPVVENQAAQTPLDLALSHAASTRKQTTLNQVLAKVPPASRAQALGHSLVMAAGRGEGGSVQFLLAQKAAADFRLPDGSTALMQAARSGQAELVKLLLSKGLRPADVDGTGRNALFYAAEGGHLAVLKLLQAAGGKLDAVDEEGLTLLMQAARYKHPETARYLHEQGLPLEAKDMLGRTALLWAAFPLWQDSESEERQYRLVEYLLANKADTRIKDSQGQTVLHALLGPQVDASECLVAGKVANLFEQADFELEARDLAGRTPLMLLTHAGGGEKMFKALLARRVDPNLQDKQGNTALHHLLQVACTPEPEHGPQSIKYYYPDEFWASVKILLQHGANPRIKNREGKTPLDLDATLLSPPQQ